MNSEKRDVVLRGGWLLSPQETLTNALLVKTGEALQLTAALHRSLWSDGGAIRALGSIQPLFASLGNALLEEPKPPCLGSVLEGSGWGLMFLELTGRCNESCSHCYASSSPEVEAALGWEQIESIVRDVQALGFTSLQFTGGDPLVSKHIEAAVSLAFELKIPFLEVYTNGLAFNERLADLFVQCGVSMALSVYSHDPIVHDRVTRTTDSHARTCRAIQLAMKKGITVRVAGVQGCEDEQDERALRDFLVNMGVPAAAIKMDRQRPVGRGNWTEETELLPAEKTDHSGRKQSERGKLSVSYTGNVVPCIFDRESVLGNIRQQSLRDILNREISFTQTSSLGTAPTTLPLVSQFLACGDCRVRHELLTKLGVVSRFKK